MGARGRWWLGELYMAPDGVLYTVPLDRVAGAVGSPRRRRLTRSAHLRGELHGVLGDRGAGDRQRAGGDALALGAGDTGVADREGRPAVLGADEGQVVAENAGLRAVALESRGAARAGAGDVVRA